MENHADAKWDPDALTMRGAPAAPALHAWLVAAIVLAALFMLPAARALPPAQQAARPAAQATTQSPPSVHALLIGISDYGPAGLTPLMGPENDVRLMRDILVRRFAVPAANVRLLLNPTHLAIEQEVAALRQRVRRSDIVYIHYSGHGSTAPDPGERRGEDQTWVPFGARSHRLPGVNDWDVLDKELAVWLKPLYELTDDVIFVSDSCHSGGVSRGVAAGVRSSPAVVRPHPLLGKLPAVDQPRTGIRIGAARDFEPAVELDNRNGNPCADSAHCYGVFTWNWAQALMESRPGEAWGDVFSRANARITTMPSVYQQPQLEGRADRAVFAARFAAPTPSVEVLDAGAGGAVLLNAGVLDGVSVGSTYRSLQRGSGAPAILRVTSVEALHSQAQVTSGTVRRADLVVESSHAYATPRISLFVGASDAHADAAWVERVRRDLAGHIGRAQSNFAIEPVAERADWWLYLVRPGIATDAAPSAAQARRLPGGHACAQPCAAPQLWVVSRQGELINQRMRFDLQHYDQEFARLVDDLGALAWSQEVRRLAAHGNATQVRASVTVHRPPPGADQQCAASTTPGSGWSTFGPYPLDALKTPPRLGDCLSFELENRDPDRTWYGYLVAVGPDFAVQPVLPEPGSNSDAARIPPSSRMGAPPRFYHLNAPGRESILLLASDGPVRVQSLQHLPVRGAPASQLDALLATVAAGRGEVQAAGSWGATSEDIWIEASGPATAPHPGDGKDVDASMKNRAGGADAQARGGKRKR